MAEIIKPKDLNPEFLKNIEGKYGKIDMVNDFFKPDLTTYYKTTDIDARGNVTHKVVPLPSFGKLFKSLGQARSDAEELSTDDTLRGNEKFQSQVTEMMENLSDSIEDTKLYKENMAMLSKNLTDLNQVYGNMLKAMTISRD